MLSLLCELYKYATHITVFCPSHWKKPLSLRILRTQVVRIQKNPGLRLTLASSRRKRLCYDF